ncbi:MAG: sigma-70 family RNA polymerase sigma factor [Pseudomonadota bacterium]
MAVPAHHDPDIGGDQADLQAAATGDARAASRLYDAHARTIYAIGLSMLRSPTQAEDVVQDSFLRLWRHIDDLARDAVPLRPWLIRVASNRCIDILRKHGEVCDDGMPEPMDAAPGPHDQLATAQLGAEIDRALLAITDGQRLALTLTAKLGLSTREAANAMDMGERAVESLVARAKKALRRKLADVAADFIER